MSENNKTIALIETTTKQKVWIGITSFLSYISIGIEKEDGMIWTGNKIWNEDNTPALVKAWYIGNLYSKVLPFSPDLCETKCLNGCVAAFKSDRIPYEEEDLKFLKSIYPTIDDEIRTIDKSIPPASYIEVALKSCIDYGITFNIHELEDYVEKLSIKSDLITLGITTYKEKMLREKKKHY